MTTFPYLKIARIHGVSYRQIMEELSQVELSETWAEITGSRASIDFSEQCVSQYRDRQRAIRAAWMAENERRWQVSR